MNGQWQKNTNKKEENKNRIEWQENRKRMNDSAAWKYGKNDNWKELRQNGSKIQGIEQSKAEWQLNTWGTNIRNWTSIARQHCEWQKNKKEQHKNKDKEDRMET